MQMPPCPFKDEAISVPEFSIYRMMLPKPFGQIGEMNCNWNVVFIAQQILVFRKNIYFEDAPGDSGIILSCLSIC